MKNIYLLLIILFTISSCEMTEKVVIGADDSVNYGINFDLSSMGGMIQGELEKEGIPFPLDTTMTYEQFTQSNLFGSGDKAQDLADKEMLELYKDFIFKMKLNDKNSMISMFVKKNNVTEFNQFYKELGIKSKEMKAKKELELAQLGEDEEAEEEGNDPFGDSPFLNDFFSEIKFNYDGKTFERISKLSDEYSDIELDSEEGEAAKLLGLLSMIKYNLEYQFPKPVKSISDTTARFSSDRKTVYLNLPLLDVIKNKSASNFKVELDD